MATKGLFRRAVSFVPSPARRTVARSLARVHSLFRRVSVYRWLDDLVYTVRRYRRTLGRWPNLVRPTTFNEHLNRKKLFDRRPLLTTLADKYAVRQYVRDRVGAEYLIHLYQVAERPEEIDFAKLPDRFVIKATHGSRWNIIVRDKDSADEQAIQRQLAEWLSCSYYERGREWCYKDVAPRLIVEEFLGDENGEIPWDYKFFCFGGKARFVQVDFDRFEHHTKNLYDMQWNRLHVAFNYAQSHHRPPAPCQLGQMVRVAECLSEPLDFVRVDLYDVDGRIKFGEMTHYPVNGFGTFTPERFDALFGSYWPKQQGSSTTWEGHR